MSEQVIARILSLVQSALQELELRTQPVSSSIQKAIRIARLRQDYENVIWLTQEMSALVEKEAKLRLYAEVVPHLTKETFARLQKRFVEEWIQERSVVLASDMADKGLKAGDEGVLGQSVPELERRVESYEQQISQLVPPPGLHPVDLYHVNNRLMDIRAEMAFSLSQAKSVLDRIAQRVHTYLAKAEKELMFGQANADLFERNRRYVDEQLAIHAPDVAEQLAAAYRRAAEDNSEARSQGLTSCRRVLKTLADRLYPATNELVKGHDGKERKLTDERYVARLWQFVAEHTASNSARDLLGARIEDLGRKVDAVYDITNKGVHADVPEFEANQAFIQTYLLVGDLLRLRDRSSAATLPEDQQLATDVSSTVTPEG